MRIVRAWSAFHAFKIHDGEALRYLVTEESFTIGARLSLLTPERTEVASIRQRLRWATIYDIASEGRHLAAVKQILSPLPDGTCYAVDVSDGAPMRVTVGTGVGAFDISAQRSTGEQETVAALQPETARFSKAHRFDGSQASDVLVLAVAVVVLYTFTPSW